MIRFTKLTPLLSFLLSFILFIFAAQVIEAQVSDPIPYKNAAISTGDVKALDFREKAPSRATRNMFLDEDGQYLPGLSRSDGLAAGVPGTVDGMISALERHGTLPLEVVLEPAIRMAEKRNG